MNIIQNQADEFTMNYIDSCEEHKDLIEKVRSELCEYRKNIYKVEFVQRIIQNVKIEYDNHIEDCTNPKDCMQNKFYENSLFFLQEELEDLENNLTPYDFAEDERKCINESLVKILNELNDLKLGQELTYNDLSEEFEELKDLYFLNKKNWIQLFQGKITEMVAGGIISEAISKNIVQIVTENYKNIIAG